MTNKIKIIISKKNRLVIYNKVVKKTFLPFCFFSINAFAPPTGGVFLCITIKKATICCFTFFHIFCL